MLTAGHCVYNTDTKEWASSITITPARLYSIEPYGRDYATTMYTSQAYIDSGNINGDWGIIELENSIGTQTGWCGISVPEDSSILKNAYVGILGYPIKFSGQLMQSGRGKILSISTYRIFHDVDTTTGQSGSGIFIGNYSDGYIVGIHTCGIDNTKNGGTRITSGLLSIIQSHMK